MRFGCRSRYISRYVNLKFGFLPFVVASIVATAAIQAALPGSRRLLAAVFVSFAFSTRRFSPPNRIGAQLPAIRAGAKSRYVQEADACVQDILSRGKPVILVGGTGLYIDSLIAGRQFAPLPQTGRREALERRAAEEGAQPLLDELRAVDPERAARLSVSDVKRIVRALEIWQETGRTMTDFDRESRAIPPRYRPLWLGLHFPERAQLYARIDLRVELMYAQGLAQEVRALLDSGVPDRATSLQAIGYKQVVQALEEGLPPEAALGTIQQATRRYAKRQMTWFRANPAVQWLDASAGADEIFRAALQKAADFDSGI